MKKTLRIAIIGSVDRPPEEKAKLTGGLAEGENGLYSESKVNDRKKVAVDLGRELVNEGHSIVVYDDKEHFLEPHIIRGYIEGGNAKKDSIRVYYSLNDSSEKIPFIEYKKGDKKYDCFEYRKNTDKEWEVSFYNSLTTNDPDDRIDGAIFLGGGRSTLIAGVVMIGYGKLIVASPEFGTAAEKVLNHLRKQKPSLKKQIEKMEDIDCTANTLVRLFSEQKNIIKEEEKRQRQEARKTNARNLNLIAMLCTCLALLAIPLAFVTPNLGYPFLLFLILFVPAFAGAGGAAAGEIYKARAQRDNSTPNQQSASQTFVLGFIVGATYVVFVTIPQLVANAIQSDANIIIQARGLILTSVPIGLAAGLALDTVIERLQGAIAQKEINVPDTVKLDQP